jgi:hypothetical protein
MKDSQSSKIKSKMNSKIKNFTLKKAILMKCYLALKLIRKTLLMSTKSLWKCQSLEILKVQLILLSTKLLKIITLDGTKIVLSANLEKIKKPL